MKKSYLTLLAIMAGASLPAAADEATGELTGSGSEEYPYVLESMWDVQLLRQRLESGNWREKYKDKYFVLTTDLHINNRVLDDDGNLINEGKELDKWTPIGRDDYYRSFQAHFDGQGHTVYGLYVDTDAKDAGFFGYMYDGSIKNLNFRDCYVKGSETMGAVVGRYSKGEVRNCHVQGLVEKQGPTFQAGLVAGNGNELAECSASGRVAVETVPDEWGYAWNCSAGGVCGKMDWAGQCSSDATVEAKGWCSIGGIAGSARSIYESVNAGKVTTNYGGGIGGIVGSATWVGKCENRGTVEAAAKGARIGGISGSCTGNSTISECINHTSFVIAGDSIGVGGIVAYPEADRYTSVSIKGCVNYGNIEVTGENSYGGGIAGKSYAASYYGCTNYGDITIPANDAAGIASYATYHSNAYGCTNYGNITTGKKGGGILGHSADGVEGCANLGNISGIDGNGTLGGIVGRCESSSCYIKYSYNLGEVSNGYNNGGIVGSSTWGGGMYSCYNSGRIFSQCRNAQTGGLAGYAGFSIRDCYNLGDVIASGEKSRVGGLVANAFVGNGQWMTMTNCFNMGNVMSTGAGSEAGTLAASHGSWGSYYDILKNCYYLENTLMGTGYTDGLANDRSSTNYAHPTSLEGFKDLLAALDVPDYYDWEKKARYEQGLYHPVLRRYDEYSNEPDPQPMAWSVVSPTGDTVRIDLGRAFANTVLSADTTTTACQAPNVLDLTTGTVSRLMLSESHDFILPAGTDGINAAEVSYSRVGKPECQTIVLPFSSPVPENALVWEPLKIEGEVLYCKVAEEIEAGVPYIVIADSCDEIGVSPYGLDFSQCNVRVGNKAASTPCMEVGFVSEAVNPDSRYYEIGANTEFHPVENAEFSVAFKPWAKVPAGSAPDCLVAKVGSPDGVAEFNRLDDDSIDVYDLNGIVKAKGIKASELAVRLNSGFYVLSNGERIVIRK